LLTHLIPAAALNSLNNFSTRRNCDHDDDNGTLEFALTNFGKLIRIGVELNFLVQSRKDENESMLFEIKFHALFGQHQN